MSSQTHQPVAYVVAGPNDAGKTTFATEFLPDFVQCRNFLNADLIAAGLSPFDPESQNVRAAGLLLNESANLSLLNRTSDLRPHCPVDVMCR